MEVTKILIKDKWIMAMWYSYTVEPYSAIKKTEIMTFGGKWIKRERIVIDEIGQGLERWLSG